jgi:hypothetical protein
MLRRRLPDDCDDEEEAVDGDDIRDELECHATSMFTMKAFVAMWVTS